MAAPAAGLYVHVPFCARKCAYCAFYSLTTQEASGRWLDALVREASMPTGFETRDFDTLHVGGGTPSTLSDGQLDRLVGSLSPLRLSPDAERSIEVNPGDMGPARLRHFRELGFNRLSVGVQSFHDDSLEFLGRRHSGFDARETLEAARNAGFENLNVDLIYGLPGRGARAWRREVEEALRFEPTHLSTYELSVEKGTPLFARKRELSFQIGSDALNRDLFLVTHELLGERGWVHYEVSNHARTERHRSGHNLKYWTHAPYLGLGPAAHSFDGHARRWWNPRSLDAYLDRLEAGRRATEDAEDLDGEALRLERLALGFRIREGVALADLRGDPGALEETIEAGLLRIEQGRVLPTAMGMLHADGLARRFA
jgi:oxygen-independent coproporphyrinogen-3 oxidase